MQVSTCPECNAPIGGSGHHLHASNAPDREFEALAVQHVGAGESPWGRPW